MSLSPHQVHEACKSLRGKIRRTPLVTSRLINEWLGATIWFKLEGLQVTGSFKPRGATYAMLQAMKKHPQGFQAALFSSGNHAQGCAWAGKLFGIPVEVFMTEATSKIKIQATQSYGATVRLSPTRREAEHLCDIAGQRGSVCISPFDHDDVILGGSSALMEVLEDTPEIEAVFAPCGGGGWLSGCVLARQATKRSFDIYGCEPQQASDAAQSVQQGRILRFTTQPTSLADGARTPGVCERTFTFLKQLQGFYLASEPEIIYWCQWLSHILKIPVEPTSSLAMVGAWKYLQEHRESKGPLVVMLSGSNIGAETQKKIWENSCLEITPSRDLQLDQSMQVPLPELLPIQKI